MLSTEHGLGFSGFSRLSLIYIALTVLTAVSVLLVIFFSPGYAIFPRISYGTDENISNINVLSTHNSYPGNHLFALDNYNTTTPHEMTRGVYFLRYANQTATEYILLLYVTVSVSSSFIPACDCRPEMSYEQEK